MPHRRPGLQGMHDEAGDSCRRRSRPLAERAEELRPGALRLGQINGVGCYAVQDHGQRVVGALASQAGMPQWLQRPYFARPEDCGFDTGLVH